MSDRAKRDIVLAILAAIVIAVMWLGPVLVVGAHAESCLASWYQRGARTANGERFRPDSLTAAHRSLPFGTRLRVTWRGRSVVVRVNDRGPARSTGRCLDLSRGSARALGMIGAGEGRVTFERADADLRPVPFPAPRSSWPASRRRRPGISGSRPGRGGG